MKGQVEIQIEEVLEVHYVIYTYDVSQYKQI